MEELRIRKPWEGSSARYHGRGLHPARSERRVENNSNEISGHSGVRRLPIAASLRGIWGRCSRGRASAPKIDAGELRARLPEALVELRIARVVPELAPLHRTPVVAAPALQQHGNQAPDCCGLFCVSAIVPVIADASDGLLLGAAVFPQPEARFRGQTPDVPDRPPIFLLFV